MTTDPTIKTADKSAEVVAPAAPAPQASYILPLPELAGGSPGQGPETPDSLSGPLLAQNVLWFCRLRWVVIGTVLLFGLLGHLPPVAAALTLHSPGAWPFVVAGVLIAGNLFFLAWGRGLLHSREESRLESPEQVAAAATAAVAAADQARRNLRSQIVMDLLVLTGVIHFVGSIQTYALFVYLIHIVLACIFFPRRQSLAVTILAIALYAACITIEQTGLIPPRTIFAGSVQSNASAAVVTVNFFSAIAIWLVVWSLASRLSTMVRQRDAELATTNRRLLAAQSERSRHMLTTTHQLKAPFAAIDANAQLLATGLCGPLPEDAKLVAERIVARCRRLASEIKEMLQLANLDSDGQLPPAPAPLDLAEAMGWCIHQIEPLAGQRGVTIEQDLKTAAVLGVEDHLRMVFSNLLSNAVIYCRPGGRVRVSVRPVGPAERAGVVGDGSTGEPGWDSPPAGEPADRFAAVATVADNGIGIAAEKLPHIFQEYYRTQEAVAHNKESSGLGLSIVRHIAERHRIRLRVQSQPGAGTTFELWFPAGTDKFGQEASG